MTKKSELSKALSTPFLTDAFDKKSMSERSSVLVNLTLSASDSRAFEIAVLLRVVSATEGLGYSESERDTERHRDR